MEIAAVTEITEVKIVRVKDLRKMLKAIIEGEVTVIATTIIITETIPIDRRKAETRDRNLEDGQAQEAQEEEVQITLNAHLPRLHPCHQGRMKNPQWLDSTISY